MSLVPCPHCNRHVLVIESVCPFCARSLPADLSASVVPGTAQRLGRAALFTFAATLAAAGCNRPSTSAPEVTAPTRPTPDAATFLVQPPADPGAVVTAYGVPAPPPQPTPPPPQTPSPPPAMARYAAPPPPTF